MPRHAELVMNCRKSAAMFQNTGKFSFDKKRRALLALKPPQFYLEYILHLILARFNFFAL